MSFQVWIDYGIGICTDEIPENVERLEALLALAPTFREKVCQWLSDCQIEKPVWDDYMEFDQDFSCRLATILKEVIAEVEGIELTACCNYDGNRYLLYQPRYPWELKPCELELTEEAVHALFDRYISVLTDAPITVEAQGVENGG